MSSSLNWVDFAEEDRQRVKEVLYLFRDKEIVEELGIGTVRDAFSDIFFPGTSTLHTRAKYMLFVPWIFINRERLKTPSDKIEEYSRWDEINLTTSLIESGETDGVIGRISRDKLKILPSSMYWSGLGAWGIRKFPGTLDQYFRSLDDYYKYKDRIAGSDSESPLTNIQYNWDPHIIKPTDDFPKKATLKLSYDEAEYLRDKIKTNCRNTLLAFLVSETEPVQVDFIWEHPQYGDFKNQHQEIIKHARNFSEVLYGASLLYNLMLSQKRENREWIDKYENKIKSWADEMSARFHEIQRWGLREFWEIVLEQNNRIPYFTRRFIEDWIDIVRSTKNLAKIYDNKNAGHLISQRESRIKGSRSRFKNKSMLMKWTGTSGVYKQDFRWGTVQKIVNDILEGLKRLKNA